MKLSWQTVTITIKRNYINGDVRAQGACEVDGVPCARATGAEWYSKYIQKWRNWQVTAQPHKCLEKILFLSSKS